MDSKDWEKELKEYFDNTTKEGCDSYIGPVGTEGLFQIGKGVFTGEKGL